MVKAMDFESEGVCVHVRFPARAISFFYLLFFFMMMIVERRAGMSAANVGAS